MTQVSSKGLLPQLVEVLRALTDSQTLLAQRVRGACIEHLGGPSSGVRDASSGPAPDSSRQTRTIVATNPTRGDLRGEGSPEQLGEATTPPAFDTTASMSHQAAGAATATADRPEDRTPSSQTREATTAFIDDRDARPRETSLRQPCPGSTGREDPDRAAATRDYNFFDELDDKLAGLPDPEVRDDEAERPEESAV